MEGSLGEFNILSGRISTALFFGLGTTFPRGVAGTWQITLFEALQSFLHPPGGGLPPNFTSSAPGLCSTFQFPSPL